MDFYEKYSKVVKLRRKLNKKSPFWCVVIYFCMYVQNTHVYSSLSTPLTYFSAMCLNECIPKQGSTLTFFFLFGRRASAQKFYLPEIIFTCRKFNPNKLPNRLGV